MSRFLASCQAFFIKTSGEILGIVGFKGFAGEASAEVGVFLEEVIGFFGCFEGEEGAVAWESLGVEGLARGFDVKGLEGDGLEAEGLDVG